MIDLRAPDAAAPFLDRLQDFIEEQVVPSEAEVAEDDVTTGRVEREVFSPFRAAARGGCVATPKLRNGATDHGQILHARRASFRDPAELVVAKFSDLERSLNRKVVTS